ncbi:hypothetical protein BJX65DRAFT_62761 [Aspergillus insuetus]
MRRRCIVSEPAYSVRYHGIIVEPWWEELKQMAKSGKGHSSIQKWLRHPSQPDICRIKRKLDLKAVLNKDDGGPETPNNDQDTSNDILMESFPRDDAYTPDADSNLVAALRIEHYYTKYNGFRHKYKPQEYWCFHCLASREGWELDEVWVSAPELSKVMNVYSDTEEGPGTDGDAYGHYSDGERMDGDDPGSTEDVESPGRGRKRKIVEIS